MIIVKRMEFELSLCNDVAVKATCDVKGVTLCYTLAGGRTLEYAMSNAEADVLAELMENHGTCGTAPVPLDTDVAKVFGRVLRALSACRCVPASGSH